MWCVYLLRCGDGTLYAGITNDLERRVEAHQRGRGARYTRGRGPLKLVFSEACEDKGAALRREYALKQLPRGDKLALARRFSQLSTSRRPKRKQRARILDTAAGRG